MFLDLFSKSLCYNALWKISHFEFFQGALNLLLCWTVEMVDINELHIRPSYKIDNSFGLVDDALTREPILFLATLNKFNSMNNNVETLIQNWYIQLTIMLKDHWTLVFGGNYNAEIRLNTDIYNNAVHKKHSTLLLTIKISNFIISCKIVVKMNKLNQ